MVCAEACAPRIPTTANAADKKQLAFMGVALCGLVKFVTQLFPIIKSSAHLADKMPPIGNCCSIETEFGFHSYLSCIFSPADFLLAGVKQFPHQRFAHQRPLHRLVRALTASAVF